MARRTRLALGVVAGVIAAAVIGGISWAAVGDGPVVTACAKGDVWRAVSTINPAESCKAQETRLQMYSKAGADAEFLSPAEAAASFTYTGGTGINLSGSNAFSIAPAYQVKNTPDCASGEFVTGFDDDGDVECASAAVQLQSRIVFGGSHEFDEPFENATVFASCNSGETLTGGGYNVFEGGVFATEEDVDVYKNHPFDADTWRVAGEGSFTGGEVIQAYAVCSSLVST